MLQVFEINVQLGGTIMDIESTLFASFGLVAVFKFGVVLVRIDEHRAVDGVVMYKHRTERIALALLEIAMYMCFTIMTTETASSTTNRPIVSSRLYEWERDSILGHYAISSGTDTSLCS